MAHLKKSLTTSERIYLILIYMLSKLVQHWYNFNGTNSQKISKYDKTYLLMSSTNIDTFCQWILDTRKLCTEKGVAFDNLTITSKLKFISYDVLYLFCMHISCLQ